MNDPYRDDKKPEEKVYFQYCGDCGWEDLESWDTPGDADRKECCPWCESEDLEIGSDFV